MKPSQFQRIATALEQYGGEFFQALAPAFKAPSDPINRDILLTAFKSMNGSDKYLPGGIHYEETTPEYVGLSELDRLHETAMSHFFGPTK
tara:strand:- start:466 stop:735 length:270 start_codon:yes stop_codon:yes gene_type:complete